MLSEKPWKPEAVARLLSGFFLGIVLGASLVQWLDYNHWTARIGDPNVVRMLVSTLSFQGTVLLFIIWFLHDHRLGWGAGFGFSRATWRRSVVFAILAAIVVTPLAIGLGWMCSYLMEVSLQIKVVEQPAIRILKAAPQLREQIYLGLTAILFAPVVEELLFRGILYPAIKQSGYPRVALWGTSILFAVTHMNLMTLVPLTFLAVVLALLYEATNDLLAPIVTHSLFNAANFFWLLTQAAALPGGSRL